MTNNTFHIQNAHLYIYMVGGAHVCKWMRLFNAPAFRSTHIILCATNPCFAVAPE